VAAAALAAVSLNVAPVTAQTSTPVSDSASASSVDAGVESAVRASAKSYEAAFAKGDAAALAAMWAENGTYTDDVGNVYTGRAEIEQVFKAYFKDDKADRNLTIDIKSIKALGDKAAIERGIAQVKDINGKLMSAAPYTVIHVNNNGTWEMASVNEAPAQFYNNLLEKLGWMSGEWQAKGPGGEANLSTRWAADKHFMVAKFHVKTKDGEQLEDMQIIGVDPGKRAIVSWVFDSEGGYGRGIWSTDGKRWAVNMVRTSPEGMRMTARNILEPKDSDSFVWKSTNRRLNGLAIPDSDSITVNRIHL